MLEYRIILKIPYFIGENMNNTEKYKGQTVGVILYVLLSGDRHTDELKEIIDTKFSEVKIGTLYSIISRMKAQDLIVEYRASSNDGSRRKYYKISENGRKVYGESYFELFKDAEPLVKEVEEEIKNEPKKPEIDNVFLEYVKKAESEDFTGDIDFSSVVIEKKAEVIEQKPVQAVEQEQVIIKPQELNLPEQHPVDFDSLVGSEYEYNSVLNKLFPKANSQIADATQESVEIQENDPTDFTNVYEFSERENVKIRTSSDTNRYQGTKILDRKLKFHASLIILGLSIIEYLILSLIFIGSVPFSLANLGKISAIFGSFAILMLVIYLLGLKHTGKDLPKFINVYEIALAITIAFTIITFAVASIRGIDYQNANQVFNMLVLPITMSVNCPIYVTTVHLLSSLDFYQTV